VTFWWIQGNNPLVAALDLSRSPMPGTVPADADPQRDALVIDLTVHEDVGLSGSYPASSATMLAAAARRAWKGRMILLHRIPAPEILDRIGDAWSAPGLQVMGSRASSKHWARAGIRALQEPVQPHQLLDMLRGSGPDQTAVAALQVRLILVAAFQQLRADWHQTTNWRAALRILGGAVLSWLDDYASRHQPLRGLPPAVATQVLAQWAETLGTPEATILLDLADHINDLASHVEVALDHEVPRDQPGEPGPPQSRRQAILIDDEAITGGWLYILRPILLRRFRVSLDPSDAETDLLRAIQRLSDNGGQWLQERHLMILDLNFPGESLGGLKIMEAIERQRSTVPVLLASAVTSGPAVRLMIGRGVQYFFKEYGDERSAVDYYRALEAMIGRTLASTPLLLADRIWAQLWDDTLNNPAVDTTTMEGLRASIPWVEQAIDLLRPPSFDKTRWPTFDLSAARTGTAQEALTTPTYTMLTATLPSHVHLPPWSALRLYISPSALIETNTGYWHVGNLALVDEFRHQCGWYVRNLRNFIMHARIPPNEVTDLDALLALLAFAYYAYPASMDDNRVTTILSPVWDHLVAENSSTAIPHIEDAAVARIVVQNLGQAILSGWNAERPPNMSERHSLEQILRFHTEEHGEVILSNYARCALPARIMQAYCDLLEVTPCDEVNNCAPIISKLCWLRIQQLLVETV
jgi:hypothetical protein